MTQAAFMASSSSCSSCLLPAEPPTKRQFTAPSADVGWHCFSHQQAALDFADAHHSIWAMEKNGRGSRSYLVATREDFWRRYRTLPGAFRHFYELIRAERPCHLYLDIEFCRRANPVADGDRMVRTLLDELRSSLAELLGVEEGADEDWCRVVDLDSSTEKKFSRHLILRLHDGATAFADNAHCGRFVHGVCAALLRRRHAEPRVAELFVAPPAGAEQPAATDATETAADAAADAADAQSSLAASAAACPQALRPAASAAALDADAPPPCTDTAAAAASCESAASSATPVAARVCLVDLTVYSRHRCFRLYKSSKAGKRAELLPAHMSDEERFFMSHAAETAYFLASLVTNVPPHARLLRIEDCDGQRRADSGALAAAASGSADGLVQLPRPPSSGGGGRAAAMQRGEWPYAELVRFVLDAWSCKTGLPSFVSRWSLERTAEHARLTLALTAENRWCAHVQRAHRSNGTTLRIDLTQSAFAQFCYDAECRAGGWAARIVRTPHVPCHCRPVRSWQWARACAPVTSPCAARRTAFAAPIGFLCRPHCAAKQPLRRSGKERLRQATGPSRTGCSARRRWRRCRLRRLWKHTVPDRRREDLRQRG
jgi:hypothetical protein